MDYRLDRPRRIGSFIALFSSLPLWFWILPATAQDKPIPEGWKERLLVKRGEGCLCCFEGEPPEDGDLLARPPSRGEVEAIVANIVKYAGLAPNFRVVEVDDDNAYAMVGDGDRILGFGDRYLRSISTSAGTDWARLGVMAHEVGHHLQGHTDDDLDRDGPHERELQADEYAGFICGMMGASREDATGHTSLMGEEGSESHPPRSLRIEATERGWLMAQHIRRSVKEDQACPVFEMTGAGFERRAYLGTIDGESVKVDLVRSPDHTVFGTYQFENEDAPKLLRFTGRSNEFVNQITLEEYFGCEPSSTIFLARTPSLLLEEWTGRMRKTTDVEVDVKIWRAPDPLPETGSDVGEPGDPSEFNFVTTLSGFEGRWLAVTSKGTPYTRQVHFRSEEFPMDQIRSHYDEGLRITHIAGDGNGWAVFMSEGTGYTHQTVIGPGPIDETSYGERRDAEFRITSLAGYQDSWVMVMSKDSGLGEQRFTFVGPFKTDWIEARNAEGYRITQVAGDDDEEAGSWMVVMSKGSGLGDQVYSDGSGFPTDWIGERWEQGYHITAASGFDNWRIVMSRETGYTYQGYKGPESEFPEPFIDATSGKPHAGTKGGNAVKAKPGGVLKFEQW